MKKIAFVISIILLVTGCSSSADKQKQEQLELLASSRASVISSELPLEFGPLSVMRAISKGSTVEIMMLYNSDHQGAKPIDQVVKTSINVYCSDALTKSNLDIGLTYRIQIRNNRGQLMIDQFVTKESCTVQ
ncbi:GspS/AspS pilotin family protein [Vibrio aestuarianus]|uniref:GspS/AspS pilotin family protein n=1 Tax=Vibrio aestuarianus TaxID=28171 RepID=UPI00237CC9CD|nr:GspS/AspS pilotin family protein [Vibrio aestuarianus]MDE1238132.1 GspS/AspS pilotin family protein [Vibrio aestuarianus]